MDRFYIIANELKDIGYQITQGIQTYIEENGKECIVATKDTEGTSFPELCRRELSAPSFWAETAH